MLDAFERDRRFGNPRDSQDIAVVGVHSRLREFIDLVGKGLGSGIDGVDECARPTYTVI